MDQQDLRDWEQRCIQEEPPQCTAACPLHVDVRAFIRCIREDKWDAAMQVLRKAMPLPDLLGRICDAPCREKCLRSRRGDAIVVGELERACVSLGHAPPRIPPMPAKNQSVVVAGTGLSSLTAAWDLGRKGYAVTLLEPGDQPGAGLVGRYPRRLTQAVVDSQIDLLKQAGVKVRTGCAVKAADFIDRQLADSDALYLGLDAIETNPAWPLEADPDGGIRIDARLRQTSRPDVFAGGQTRSPVLQAAQGRWAATTIDRFLQKVSLTAGREKEGPRQTRLYTSLDNVVPAPATAMADAKAGFTPDEARQEADRCLLCECLACVAVCPYLEKYGSYPRKYAREIYNNQAIVMGARTANKLINSCSLCGLCETVCPEDFAMQDLCLQARQAMVDKGNMPPSAHEFALLDMDFSRSDRFSLARGAPDADRTAYAFFPGCQLCATDPDKTRQLYDYLRKTMDGGVGLILGCCGAPAHWAGRQALYADVREEVSRQWEALGRPGLIAACSTCYRMFREHLPDIPVQSVWTILADKALPAAARPAGAEPLAVHDPCTTRHEPEIQAAVRTLLERLGAAGEELSLGGEKTECCGFGGLMQNVAPDLAQTVASRRGALSDSDYVTYCAMCRDSLAAVGKRSLHLLDLLFADPDRPDPAGRERAGWSRRRDNRCRLKADLLAGLWKETPGDASGETAPVLRMAPDVAALLETRRILEEDIQQVIQHAESTGRRLRHPQTGRFKAAFRPRAVTFWVEYAPAGDGFEIFNAYAHRMEVSIP